MTATVTIRTRAVGAEVQNGDQSVQVPPRSEHVIQVDGTGSFSVTEAEPQADEPAPMSKGETEKPAPATEASVDGSKFDHDGDGKVGGSKAKR